MNTIRVEPAQDAADPSVNIILNGDVVQGIKADWPDEGACQFAREVRGRPRQTA